jgi:integral membrane sensor domain MASE1
VKTQSNSSLLARLFKIGGLGLAYFIVARLALLLTIPPGYATAVWPAAGIALAGIMLFGREVWLGILIGSFLVNIWTFFDATHPAAILKSLPLLVVIAAGATLQALAGAYLIQRLVGFPNLLDRIQNNLLAVWWGPQ